MPNRIWGKDIEDRQHSYAVSLWTDYPGVACPYAVSTRHGTGTWAQALDSYYHCEQRFDEHHPTQAAQRPPLKDVKYVSLEYTGHDEGFAATHPRMVRRRE